MLSSEFQIQTQGRRVPHEGITVVGEAVRRLTPESAEFLAEITANAPNAAQALRDIRLKETQLAQALAQFGVQPSDLQSISLNVSSLYAPLLSGFAGVPQIGPAGFQSYATPPGMIQAQPEIQFGNYQARNTVRVNVKDPARMGDAMDAIVRSGAAVLGTFSFKVADEANARRLALDAAGKDARVKAEALAASANRQLGDLIAIAEDIIASNGDYAALRATMPFGFGAGAPRVVGELEYYARVLANFRFQ